MRDHNNQLAQGMMAQYILRTQRKTSVQGSSRVRDNQWVEKFLVGKFSSGDILWNLACFGLADICT